MDFGLALVAWAFPGGDFLPQGVDRRNAVIQTLAGEYGQLVLGPIEPTAVLGDVVKFQLAGDPAGFVRRKGAVQGCRGMGVPVVHHQPDAFRRGNVLLDQQPHWSGKVRFGALLRDVDVTPTAQGLDKPKQIGGTFPLVFRVIARWVAGPAADDEFRGSVAPGFRQNTLGDSADHRGRRTDPRHPPDARRSRDSHWECTIPDVARV